MKIAFASGKGGTGKTTLSTNLAWVLSRNRPIQYIDCDVEEPNGHLFLHPAVENLFDVSIPVPEVDQSRCIHCGACSRICRYHAIAVAPTITLTFPELCHGCGGCVSVCPSGAITEVPWVIGAVEQGRAGHLQVIQGSLNPGEAMSPPVIRAVKAHADPAMLTILDAPPGTSCPSTSALQGADMVVLVGEPTRFGLYDLSLAVQVVRSLGLRFGVVINRSDWGDERLDQYCQQESIPVLGHLPHDRRLAEASASGRLAAETLPEWAARFTVLGQRILSEVQL